jgi:hypothetical protein
MDSNFHRRWKRKAKWVLEEQDLWDCVNPGFVESTPSKEDRRRDLRARLLLLGTIEEWEQFAECASAKEVWSAVDHVCNGDGLEKSSVQVEEDTLVDVMGEISDGMVVDDVAVVDNVADQVQVDEKAHCNNEEWAPDKQAHVGMVQTNIPDDVDAVGEAVHNGVNKDRAKGGIEGRRWQSLKRKMKCHQCEVNKKIHSDEGDGDKIKRIWEIRKRGKFKMRIRRIVYLLSKERMHHLITFRGSWTNIMFGDLHDAFWGSVG